MKPQLTFKINKSHKSARTSSPSDNWACVRLAYVDDVAGTLHYVDIQNAFGNIPYRDFAASNRLSIGLSIDSGRTWRYGVPLSAGVTVQANVFNDYANYADIGDNGTICVSEFTKIWRTTDWGASATKVWDYGTSPTTSLGNKFEAYWVWYLGDGVWMTAGDGYQPSKETEFSRSTDDGLTWLSYIPTGMVTRFSTIDGTNPVYAPIRSETDGTFHTFAQLSPGRAIIGLLEDTNTDVGSKWDVEKYNYVWFLTEDHGLSFRRVKEVQEEASNGTPLDKTNLEGWPATVMVNDKLVTLSDHEWGTRMSEWNHLVYMTDPVTFNSVRGIVKNTKRADTLQFDQSNVGSQIYINANSNGNIYPNMASLPKHTSRPIDIEATFGGSYTGYRDAIVAAAPIAFWRLDATAGVNTLIDEMGNHNVTLPVTQELVPSGFPAAIFGDSSQSCTLKHDGVPVPVAGSESWNIKAVEFWYDYCSPRMPGFGDALQPLISRDNLWTIFNGKLHANPASYSAATSFTGSSTDPALDRGYAHIVFNCEAGSNTIKVYVNGTLAGTLTGLTAASLGGTGTLHLLSSLWGNTRDDDDNTAIHGDWVPVSAFGIQRPSVCTRPRYSNLAVYDRELTTTEITTHATLGFNA